MATRGIHLDVSQTGPAFPLNLERIHESGFHLRERNALDVAGDALERNRPGRVFADFRFGNEAVRNVAILSREISGGEGEGGRQHE
ncbi:MAG: hypothetical protein AUG85_00270 [Gemmatimonadetes bacterium 13_1_20CM_4_66_11]|nr:MAG: hypothetical protein AUG85_00270 [Gemmatimonadetes bacterium 13_1_20CM_4_66_11]